MIKINEGRIDRMIRIIIGALALIVGFFWVGGLFQLILYLLGIVLSGTGFVGFCGLYPLLKIQTCDRKEKAFSKTFFSILFTVFLIMLILGSVISSIVTKNKFLEDYGKMNGYYKQTLFLTGQGKRDEAIKNYEAWKSSFIDFKNKYSDYKPFALRNDKQFNNDLANVSKILDESKMGVYSGDLATTHKKLEEVRPIFQDMFKRNGFSMLSLVLTDFHDAMEKNIEAADAKNSEAVIATYEESNKLLRQIEAESASADVKAIRSNLDELLQLAKDGKKDELPKKASELKSSFIKVYLQ